jgi:DNA integrity scanning protein DisA with diadenylate cyclase activity
MDKQHIEKNEIEIKYLRKQLSEEQLEEFEVYLMENPEMLEQLQLNQVLCDGVPEDQQSKSSISDLFSNIRQEVFKPPYQLVAGLSIGAISSFFVLSLGLFTPAYIELNQVGVLSQMRSAEDPWKGRSILEFPARNFGVFSKDTFILSVPANIQLGESYRVNIYSEESGKKEISLGVNELQSDQYGTLFVVLKTQSFPPGVYRLEVSPDASIGKGPNVSTFVFETKVRRT